MAGPGGTTVGVVGGGPAGLIAAETLAAAGVMVTIYEHKRSVGRKFLLAGRGGLNITHSEPTDQLLDCYGPARGRLEAAVGAFSADDLQAWCASHGEPTFVGTSGRVFPLSFRATPLLRSWLRRLDELGVVILTGHRFVGWTDGGDLQFDVADANGSGNIVAHHDAVIFAMGGASWPRVGSDGRWSAPFESAGVALVPFQAANAGIRVEWSSVMQSRFEGEPIKNTIFTVGDESVRGDAVITRSGLEGGPIYALGPALRAEFRAGRVPNIVLDLHPDLSQHALVQRLSKRRPRASAASWLKSAGVSSIAAALAREVTNNQLPDDPHDMATMLKALPLAIDSLAALDRAISTAGGVHLEAIDDAFMLVDRPGTFVAGEMLDWEAPTGGYLLQACFSTGVAAARGVLTWLEQSPAK